MSSGMSEGVSRRGSPGRADRAAGRTAFASGLRAFVLLPLASLAACAGIAESDAYRAAFGDDSDMCDIFYFDHDEKRPRNFRRHIETLQTVRAMSDEELAAITDTMSVRGAQMRGGDWYYPYEDKRRLSAERRLRFYAAYEHGRRIIEAAPIGDQPTDETARAGRMIRRARGLAVYVASLGSPPTQTHLVCPSYLSLLAQRPQQELRCKIGFQTDRSPDGQCLEPPPVPWADDVDVETLRSST
jgi:hypothetical protein